MSLRDMAVQILNRGTPCGTDGGTDCPTGSDLSQNRGTVDNGINTGLTGENINCPTVPGTGCGTVGQFQESGTVAGTISGTAGYDPYFAGHHILVNLHPVGDVWLTSNEQAAEALLAEGLPVLLESDIRWILQAQGHEARLDRLRVRFARRHPIATAIMDTFEGARVTGIRPEGASVDNATDLSYKVKPSIHCKEVPL